MTIVVGSSRGRNEPMTDMPIQPPEDLYRAVAVAQAIRWGYTKTLDPKALADFIRGQATDHNVRADADEVWRYVQRAFDTPPACTCPGGLPDGWRNDFDLDCPRHSTPEATDDEIRALLPAARAALGWAVGAWTHVYHDDPDKARDDGMLVNVIVAVLRELRTPAEVRRTTQVNERDEQILANLPAILDGILAEHRAANPNPLAGLDIPVEGGPLDGQVFRNETWWHGDWWEPEVDGARHRYVLGSRHPKLGDRPPSTSRYGPLPGMRWEYLWFYRGVVDA